MNSFPVAFYRARESLRSAVRQILLYMIVCTVLIAACSGALDKPDISTSGFAAAAITSLLFGIPSGFVAFFLVRLLRFAFHR